MHTLKDGSKGLTSVTSFLSDCIVDLMNDLWPIML